MICYPPTLSERSSVLESSLIFSYDISIIILFDYSYRNLLPEVSRVGAATVHPELPENVGGRGGPGGGSRGCVGGGRSHVVYKSAHFPNNKQQ